MQPIWSGLGPLSTPRGRIPRGQMAGLRHSPRGFGNLGLLWPRELEKMVFKGSVARGPPDAFPADDPGPRVR